MKKKVIKIVAVFTAINLLAEIFFPTVALALTGGPSQPEVESFEPVGTSEMVDLFSGDFNYNIPLFTVPGPNGGYPVNLAYHSGIGMEQEASWVGLGWNINPGEINRQVRGLPDDFNGDAIEKKTSLRPNETWSLERRPFAKEVMGFNLQMLNYQQYYNNYKGIGYTLGLSLGEQDQVAVKQGFTASLTLSISSEGGLGVQPDFAYHAVGKEREAVFHLGTSMSSRGGIEDVSFKVHRHKFMDLGGGKRLMSNSNSKANNTVRGGGVTFASSSYVPNISARMSGAIIHAGLKIGKETLLTHDSRPIKGSYVGQWLLDKNEVQNCPAYGFMYADGRTTNSSALADVNREKDVAVTKDAPSLPIPIFTYDTYSAKGQGIGSVFRPYRSDIGILTEPEMESISVGGNVTLEVGFGDGAHIGADFGMNFSESTTGGWRNDNHWSSIENLQFKRHADHDDATHKQSAVYEPFYFRSSGESTISSTDLASAYNEEPVRFNIKRAFTGTTLKTKVLNELVSPSNSTGLDLNTDGILKTERERRVQNIQYKTVGEIVADARYTDPEAETARKFIYPLSNFSCDVEDLTPYDYGTHANGHLGEITMLNPDGNRYVYALPAYNVYQKDVVFSKDQGSSGNRLLKTRSYTANKDNSYKNDQGEDHYFSYTKTPEYAHSHLLTSIVSPDYIDLKGDGPTEDDLGYYVKFNYSKAHSAYHWRVPYKDANNMVGNLSDPKDDKLSYTYGEKEVYYLHSIETKTHVARFYLNCSKLCPGEEEDGECPNIRKDSYGADSENNNGSRNVPQALNRCDSIWMCSKADLANPIKRVFFEYNYDLCGNAMNNVNYNSSYDEDDQPPANSGKLTLKRVFFRSQWNNKGELSPYIFDYHERDPGNPSLINLTENPNYSQMQMDRWGNYKNDDPASGDINEVNPYVNQMADYDGNASINATDTTLRNANASAWCLKEITLPSGGTINVDYESDDYAYVQNAPAMQMMKIIGTSDVSTTTPDTKGNIRVNANKDYRRVYFKLETPLGSSDPDRFNVLARMMNGLGKMYYKVLLKLKSKPIPSTETAYDYVEGYCDIENYGFAPASGGKHYYAWVQVENAYKDNANSKKAHPFQMSGWQYLKMQRPDLLRSNLMPAGNIYNDFVIVLDILKGSAQLLMNFYNYCDMLGYCNQIQLSGTDYRPSYIRLVSPDHKKYGGGHRVSKITVEDNWNGMSGQDDFSYGQEYSYTLPDGSSSGVAEYEPIVGGEEISLRKPVRYSNDRFLVKDKALYLEEPYGESFYPGASVGYSRVIVRSLKRLSGNTEVNKKTTTGFTVNEFYTARNFPVSTEFTDIQSKKYAVPLQIPFIGTRSTNNKGYSQGYKIELNDMHGKPRSVATYSAYAELDDADEVPVTRTDFLYKTTAAFSDTLPNYLDNTVTVLDGEGNNTSATMGRTYDFFIDMREHTNRTIEVGSQAEVDCLGLLTWPSAMPYINYADAMFRSIVTNKVIQKNGILEETRQFHEGRWINTKNLMFDAETGSPALTQVTNNFDAPVYSYSMPAHWVYDNMGPAYKNYRVKFFGVSASSGDIDIPNASRYFTRGDEVSVLQSSAWSTYYVTNVVDLTTGTDKITLYDEGGSPAAGAIDEMFVARSGRRNLQSVGAGSIVSLSNPVTDRDFPLFDLYNAQIYGDNTPPATLSGYVDCQTENSPVTINVSLGADSQTVSFSKASGPCAPYEAKLTFPVKFNSYDTLGTFSLTKKGNKVIASGGGYTYTCKWLDAENCFTECLDNVLNAQAVQFDDSWTYDYLDAGDPQDASSASISGSPIAYRFGRSGIWRTSKAYSYLVNRNQQTVPNTKIQTDGTFEDFNFYNWDTVSTNPKWTYTSEISKYSPYGFELENKDAIGNYSSAIYGYDFSVATGVASNASYYEMGYDGFEDYGISGYTAMGHGHIDLNVGGGLPSVSTTSHTGAKGITLSAATVATCSTTTISAVGAGSTQLFAPVAGQRYLVSAWFKGSVAPVLTVTGATSSSTTVDPFKIEGWQRVETQFTAPSGGTAVTITFGFTGSAAGSIDDIRILPFKSAIKTYVYDPETLWLIAELDNRNYATFYNYDEAGKLVQVKKETERGIVTIKTSRESLVR